MYSKANPVPPAHYEEVEVISRMFCWCYYFKALDYVIFTPKASGSSVAKKFDVKLLLSGSI